MAVETTTTKELITLEAPKLVTSVGIVKGLNIRLERNYKTEQFAKEIRAAGEIYEPIRIRKPVAGEEVDLSKARWVVAADGHRRVIALRHMAKHTPKALKALKPVLCLVVEDAGNEVELMLRTGSGEGKAAKELLEPLEQAIGYQRLRDRGMSPDRIGEIVGKQGQHVRQRLKLLKAPPEVRDAIPIIGTSKAENIAFRHETTGREFQIFLADFAIKATEETNQAKKRTMELLVQDAIAQHGKERKDAAVTEIKQMMANGYADPSQKWIAEAGGWLRSGSRAAARIKQDSTSRPQPEDNLRKMWPNEARDFTPWLADHLSQLGKALRLELELEEQEASVGSYSLDILARDLESDSPVIIENQLKATDHDHLGKLLTYAAEFDANVIVWIAKKFSSAHKKALNFLNDCTGEDRQFFGVKVDGWKRDASSPIAKFTPVVTPKGWREQNNTRGASKSGKRGQTRPRKTRAEKRP